MDENNGNNDAGQDNGSREGSSSNNLTSSRGVEGMNGMSVDAVEENGIESSSSEDVEMYDVGDIEFNTLTPAEVKSLEFATIEAAYEFYNQYGEVNGFSIRRHKVGRNSAGEKMWQSFVCSRHGYRETKYINNPDPKREPRPVTRCGCLAELRVRLNEETRRWVVLSFNDKHSHPLVGEKFMGFLRSHRKLTDADVAQFISMRKSGISTPKIYGSFASQSGGFDKIGFRKKDMYNMIEKQRRLQGGDVKSALKYLRDLQKTDRMMYWRYKLDADGKLLHLFWCDGSSQIDYKVFGDVLAFDATYKRNKYNCPLVVFSGVNHHKNTCVFASALVSDETEETYVWVLQQFLMAMQGKCPQSVITDGDLAIKNAIQVVFPEAHHRLCAWHLLRNATANVGQPAFTQKLKACMLGDYEIDEFEAKWTSMIEEFGLEGLEWVEDLYEKKLMWANAYIRGKFFAGLRTTSRCEALHAQVGKYVSAGNNVCEFLQHFQRCLEYIRNNEIDADFKSYYGQPVLQTPLERLERFGSEVFTRDVFYMYRSILMNTSTVKVIGVRETATSEIYVVEKFCKPNVTWNVSYHQEENEIRCSCQRMESFGIPCVHIMAVLVFLDIDELPSCVVLNRWTKGSKEGLELTNTEGSRGGKSTVYMTRYGALLHGCRQLCHLASKREETFRAIRQIVAKETAELVKINDEDIGSSQQADHESEGGVRDPVRVRTKGCGRVSMGRGRKRKRVQRCGVCRVEGHNRNGCPTVSRQRNSMECGSGNCGIVFDDSEEEIDQHGSRGIAQ